MIFAHLGGESPQQHRPLGACSTDRSPSVYARHPLRGANWQPITAAASKARWKRVRRRRQKEQPPAPPKPAPCPPDAERRRLSVWAARGWLPDGVEPASLAAAYRRKFGVEPCRDTTTRAFRAYSLRELGMALADVGRDFESQALRTLWSRALEQLQLPATRALLAQQGRLLELRDATGLPETFQAVVGVPCCWLELLQGRRLPLADALTAALGLPVAVVLVGMEP